MSHGFSDLLESKLDEKSLAKLNALENPFISDFLRECIELCNPDKVFVRNDSKEDVEYVRQRSLALGEEKNLLISGHTYHFDGINDQARDKKNTRYLLEKDSELSQSLNSIDAEEGRAEVKEYLKDIMVGKEMFVCFFCLGPADSDFSLLAVQITDSAYVSHSEDLLYRPGYEQLKNKKGTKDFFRFIHSAGELKNGCSKNVDQRRVYIDLKNELVYSVNTQYAGNTVGLKKLALRLAIQKATREGWLAEHMFLMGVKDLKNNKAYFCGAFPSMCGKTSTAMVSGESIVGDDIVYLRIRDGKVFAVNVERGIFGIIKDVNPKDDPILFKSLENDGQIIFSNILIEQGETPFWIGKSTKVPEKGVNFSGDWHPGKTDEKGNEITPSHKNARYTIHLKSLKNVDENLENPLGLEIRGLIYGGRDSDTSVPIEQALNWQQGIIIKAASLESETTAATLGKEGVRVFNPMSNMDFLSVSLAKYIEANLEFGKKLDKAAAVFSVNYFLRGKDGKFLNGIQDKRVWLKWIRLRVDNKLGALSSPSGYIPKYEDLKSLFHKVLEKEYTPKEYQEQFTIRIPESLAKIARIKEIYKDVKQIPACLFDELNSQEARLKECQSKFGDYVKPENLSEVE